MAISITKRREFIHYIFEFFGREEKDSLVSTYDIALTTKYPVDWGAFYEDIIKTSDKRILPMPKYFADKISMFKKIDTEIRLSSESIIRVILKNGREYIFTVNNLVDGPSLNKVKKRFAAKDDTTKTKISKIIKYPKETTIIGDKVFYNVNIPKNDNMTDEEREKLIAEREKELEGQTKIIFINSDKD